MKDILKCMGLLVIGLFVSVIVYPVLHEGGHFIAAVLTGGDVVEVRLFPVSYIKCKASETNSNMVIIGLGGMFLPMFLSLLFNSKNFWVWYGILLTKGICVLSFFISILSIVLYDLGVVLEDQDIVKVLTFWEEGLPFFIVLMILSLIISICSIVLQRPVYKIAEYFDLSIRKANAD